MKIRVNNPCLICGCSKSELFFKKEYSEHNYPGIFEMRRCLKCGLLFNSPRLDVNDLYLLYDKNYYFFNRNDKEEFLRIAEKYCLIISLTEYNLTHKKVLEIGSGKGYLLALLNYFGWDVQGIEISSQASKYAIKTFGVPTFNGTLSEYILSDKFHKSLLFF